MRIFYEKERTVEKQKKVEKIYEIKPKGEKEWTDIEMEGRRERGVRKRRNINNNKKNRKGT